MFFGAFQSICLHFFEAGSQYQALTMLEMTQQMLDANINFSVANAGDRGLSQYDVIILPGVPCTTAKDVERLNRYVADGGKLLLIGQGALDKGRTRLQFDTGAEYLGAGQYDKDYLVAAGDLQAGLVSSPFLCYKPALRVKPEQGTEILDFGRVGAGII